MTVIADGGNALALAAGSDEPPPASPPPAQEPRPKRGRTPDTLVCLTLTSVTYTACDGRRREVSENELLDDMPELVALKAEAAGIVRIERE